MARCRTIKPSFFLNETLAECSPMARLLFAGLWCWADRNGRLEDRPRRIKAEIFPYDAVDADELLKELHSRGFIDRYTSSGVSVIQIRSFTKHQKPHPKETSWDLPEPGNFTAEPETFTAVPGKVTILPRK